MALNSDNALNVSETSRFVWRLVSVHALKGFLPLKKKSAQFHNRQHMRMNNAGLNEDKKGMWWEFPSVLIQETPSRLDEDKVSLHNVNRCD